MDLRLGNLIRKGSSHSTTSSFTLNFAGDIFPFVSLMMGFRTAQSVLASVFMRVELML